MSRTVYLLAFPLLLAAVQVSAAPRLSADYRLDLEARQEREDEARSRFSLGLRDDFVARRLKMDYDLLGRYLYDHVNERDNTLWSGQGGLDYRIARSLSALASLNLSEIADPGVTVENELDTQTLLDGRVGLQWLSTGRGRSQFRALLQERVFRYQSSEELDADEGRLELEYRYRLNPRTGYSLAYHRFDQRYRDDVQSVLDTDNSLWQLGFDQRWSRLSLDAFANTREVEFDDGSNDRFEGYGLELAYQANTRHRLSLRVARDVQQAFRFNTLLGNALNRLEQAGLVETDGLRLSWNYRGRYTDLELSLYQDDISVINGAAADETGRQMGGDLNLLRRFNERFSARLTATTLDNDFNGNRTRLTELSLIYQWLRSRRYDLRVEVQGRQGEEAGQNADDVSLILQGRAILLP